MRKKLLVCAVTLVLAMHGAAAQESAAVRLPALSSLLAEPEQEVIDRFVEAGMREVRPHELTTAERQRVEQALAALPALHRLVLEKRLRRLGFVDGIPGAGSGLTSKVGATGKFDITLRASLIGESLTGFLTTKERRLFAADESGHTVHVDGSGVDALTYVLLHETSHVVDSALKLTADREGPFVAGIWTDPMTLSPALGASPAAATIFRRAPQVAAGRAQLTYDALAQTPFVSLYSTAAAGEDFAELVSWHEIGRRYGGSLGISIRDRNGALVHRYDPLGFPAVKARMASVARLLQQAETEAGRRDVQRQLDAATQG